MKKISILIAVRNEEKIILPCLEKLQIAINQFYREEINHKKFDIEILIGDDNDKNTKDRSAKIIKEFIEQNKNTKYNYFKIDEIINQNNLKGKVKVIHQLINYSVGETIILLDADVFVNKNWLIEMITVFYKNDTIKMLMGTTIPKSIPQNNLLSHCWCFNEIILTNIFITFQTIDWTFGQGILSIFSWLGFPQTAMGNNLIFDKKTYKELGTYKSIDFSVTEDVALFKAFQKHIKKTFFTQLFNPNSLAFTEAEPTLKDWILQRHRWFCGAWQFSDFLKKILLMSYLFRIVFVLMIIIIAFLVGKLYLISIILISLGINFLLIISFFIKLKLKISLSTFIQIAIFCCVESFLYFLVGIYFLKTKKVNWKDREF